MTTDFKQQRRGLYVKVSHYLLGYLADMARDQYRTPQEQGAFLIEEGVRQWQAEKATKANEVAS